MNRVSLFLYLTLSICGLLKAQVVESFAFSDCDRSCDFEKVINRISEQKFEDGLLKIHFGHISNCAGISKPSAQLSGDTLEINYESYLSDYDTVKVSDSLLNGGHILEITEVNETQSIVLCDCYFESEFQIAGLAFNPTNIKLNGDVIEYYNDKYKVLPIEFDLLQGDTINFKDKYGYRQGLWIKRNSKDQLIYKRTYETDLIIQGADYQYHENGNIKIKLEWVNDEHTNYFEYDPYGNLIAHKKSPFDN